MDGGEIGPRLLPTGTLRRPIPHSMYHSISEKHTKYTKDSTE